MTAQTTLTEAIDQVVREKTFTADALAGVQALKTQAVEQDRRIADLSKTLEARGQELTTARNRISTLEREAQAYQARETALEAREAKVRDLELKEVAATTKGDTLEKVFGTIFGNVRVREIATRNLPFSSTQPGGYQHTGYQPVKEELERVSE